MQGSWAAGQTQDLLGCSPEVFSESPHSNASVGCLITLDVYKYQTEGGDFFLALRPHKELGHGTELTAHLRSIIMVIPNCINFEYKYLK